MWVAYFFLYFLWLLTEEWRHHEIGEKDFMSAKKIVLFTGLGMGIIFVVLAGVLIGEMNEFEKNMTEKFTKMLVNEMRDGGAELHMAAYLGEKEKVLFLIQNGQDVHTKRTSGGYTPFHMAIFNGKTEVADLLLSKGAKMEVGGTLNQSPLHMAAMMGKVESIRFLVGKGVPLEIRADDGWRPIHIAARMGHIDAVKILIEKGAQKDSKVLGGKTAKDLAKMYKRKEVVRYLVSLD